MSSVRTVPPRRRLLIVLLVLAALAAGGVGALLGASGGGDERKTAPPPEASGREGLDRTSFLARIVPPPAEPAKRENVEGPAVPRSVAELARRLPLERKVAQLFLFGFEGTDLTADIFERLRRLDLGGIVLDASNYTDPSLLGQLGGEALVIAREAGHVPPWVLASQEGGEYNSFPDLPPSSAPADLSSADEAEIEAEATAAALRGLNVSGVLGPVIDVGLETIPALGTRVYSDDPEEVAGYADAVVNAFRRGRLLGAVAHFPGLGTADQATELGPASVGLDTEELLGRDLVPFRAAFDAGAAAVILGHGLYPMTDYTEPASLSRAVVTGLLRERLHFAGVAITDDLAEPAVTLAYPVPEAAVKAIRAGADMVFISGPAGDQQAAYAAVLQAVRSGSIPRRRLDQALLRVLKIKEGYGLIASRG